MRALARVAASPRRATSNSMKATTTSLASPVSCTTGSCCPGTHVTTFSSQPDVALAATASAISANRMEFYKRELPAACIPFDCAEGKTLFAEALAAGTMECFFPLAAQFRTRECLFRGCSQRTLEGRLTSSASSEKCSAPHSYLIQRTSLPFVGFQRW